ncbi:MAG TPA: histidine kinase [Kofleriaceae bacterium]|nr:histidine kinase [Kofleriaceae bacterium]
MWSIAIAVVVAVAAVFATGVRLFMPPAWGAAVPWERTFVYNLAHFAIWAALAPALIRLAARLPLERGAWRASLPIQVVVGCAVAAGQLAAAELVLSVIVPSNDPVRPSLIDGVRFSLAINFQAAVMTYGAIAGAAYAYFFHRREVALRAAAAEEQFRTLESHVAPHFLFNALNSVTALVDDEPDDAKRMIARLGDLLRHSLAARDRHTMSLDEELEVIVRYLDIERVRFADRLVVEIDAAADARRCQVPAFLLQPLVENAIRHGLQPSLQPVVIAVRAHRGDGRLALEVCDDAGPAIRAPAGDGLGLQRTRARLAHLYGASYLFRSGVAEPRGFRVEIEIPVSEVRP